MVRIAIELDELTARQLQETAMREGVSADCWAEQVIRERLEKPLPESWFDALGGWVDDRPIEEIMREIRVGTEEPERTDFD
jgi:hypothetical protein